MTPEPAHVESRAVAKRVSPPFPRHAESLEKLIHEARRGSLVAYAWCVALACLGCGCSEDPAYDRGPTLVMAVPDVEAVKPDNWDLDLLTFLPLTKQNEP